MTKNNVTVLIVDDTPQNIDVLKNILCDTYKIKVALNGKKAIEIIQKDESIGLVLLDVMMPEMDGYDFIKIIKSDTKTEKIPIIFVTSLGETENETKGFSLGAADYITKPVNPSIVKARVASQIELYNSRISLQSDLYKNIKLLNQYKNIVDYSSIVSKSDLSGKITYVNQEFEKISGYTKEELIGKPHSILRHPEMPSSLFKELWDTIQDHRVFQAQIKNLHKNGTSYYVKVFISPIINQNGEIEEYISIRQNITSEVLALNEEKKITKLKDEFISNMSHELRTPLNAIMGFSSILNKKQTNPEHIALSKQISSSANSLLILVNSILDLSNIRNSKFKIAHVEFNFYEKSIELTNRFKDLVHSKDLTIETDIMDSLKANFLGDWNSIDNIIMNIFTNAIKFTPDGNKISFSAEYKDGSLIMSISDNGIGINKELQEKIFEPFQQADGSTTRKYGGMGLGLSITKNLVELMSGKIELESKEGVGTTFTIKIPLKKVQEDEMDDSQEHEKTPLGIHVLIAEDNKTNQLLIKMLLNEFGITCDIANDGLEALEMYNPEIHKMILMDEDMPNMNGTESMKKIRQKYQERCGAIIAVTASSMPGDRERFLEAGMNGYVSKPIDEDILYKTIKKLL